MPRACPACNSIYSSENEFCALDGSKLVLGDPFIGKTIAGYRVDELIGSGATGSVYRAHDRERHADVALKVLRGRSEASRNLIKRFEREAEIIGAIDHPNVVKIVGFGIDGSVMYLAMELVQGTTLADEIEQKRSLPVERAVSIAAQVARGLAAAHSTGFVHRDLKPGNIMLTRVRGEECVKILDFGIAGIADDKLPITRLTQEGFTLGTPAYMAPEQMFDASVGPEADLYALGVILYEMLTGSVPFTGTVSQVMMKQFTNEPPELPVGGLINQLVKRLLAKQSDKRPKDASAVALELDQLVHAHLTHDTEPLAGPLTAEERALLEMKPPSLSDHTELVDRDGLTQLSTGDIAPTAIVSRKRSGVAPDPAAVPTDTGGEPLVRPAPNAPARSKNSLITWIAIAAFILAIALAAAAIYVVGSKRSGNAPPVVPAKVE